jgi:hypothetical protein
MPEVTFRRRAFAMRRVTLTGRRSRRNFPSRTRIHIDEDRRLQRHMDADADSAMPARQRMTCGRSLEAFAMKRIMSIVIGAALLAAAGFASAGQLALVSVHQNRFSPADCAPPNDSEECADFHAAIRRNFSKHEIGMLFGAATAYAEYPTSFDRVRARYIAFVREFENDGLAAVAAR